MTVSPVPKGFHTITPYFVLRGVPKFIDFLKLAFDAEEIYRSATPDGTVMNAEIRIGDSMVMAGECPPKREPMTAMLYLYVGDVDAVYKKALAAGGKSLSEPTDQFYGDRSGGLEDSFGNTWYIATRKENLTPEEIAARAATHGH